MGERLVVRWAFLARVTRLGFVAGIWGVGLLSLAPSFDAQDEGALLGVAGLILIAFLVVRILRPRFVIDVVRLREVGHYGSRAVAWSDVVAVRWAEDNDPYSGSGWSPDLIGRDGRRALVTFGKIPEHRVFDVNSWLREHQPDIRIDPVVPWRDRFGTWHVGEPGYDPVETMTSVRRSLVGPWEIVARSCDGGFRAEQRVVKSGAVVHAGAVREALAEAKADGVRLVREAVEAASSAHE